jgi:hypothetical protein
MRSFYLTCPQLKVLCDHYCGGPTHDELRDSKYRESILILEKYGYLEIIDFIFLYASITDAGKKRIQGAMRAI